MLTAQPAIASPWQTWRLVTTGNGYGFQIYDVDAHKITSFLEHPYRYLRPSDDPRAPGVERRNLAHDFYFGVRHAGKFQWLNQARSAVSEYVDETNVIHAKLDTISGAVDSYYFSPFDLEANAMVAVLRAPIASSAAALFNFHLGRGVGESVGYEDETVRAIGNDAFVEAGPGGGAMVYIALSGAAVRIDCALPYAKLSAGGEIGDARNCRGDDIVPAIQSSLGADGSIAVAMAYTEDAARADDMLDRLRRWGAKRPPSQLVTDALNEWRIWRKKAAISFDDDISKRLWRQSEAVLRMAQVREPITRSRSNHGMILASLPPGEWHIGWVRDGAYAIAALARSGHYNEARAALNFFLNAPAGKHSSYVNGADYQVSVCRYFGSGEEEADYSGESSPNIELDGWGLALWAARLYVEMSGDTHWLWNATRQGPSVYQQILRGVAMPLERNLEADGTVRADSSIWEVHDAHKRHFAYTSATAARGFCDMAKLASISGHAVDAMHYRDVAARVRAGFLSRFVDQAGAVQGQIEAPESGAPLDGSVVEAINWGLLDDGRSTATLKALEGLRVVSGGFKRRTGSDDAYDNHEWAFLDMRIAVAQARTGSTDRADKLLKTIAEKSQENYFLLPERYNSLAADIPIGAYVGSTPMVGYGAGAYMMALLDRAGQYEKNDCGE